MPDTASTPRVKPSTIFDWIVKIMALLVIPLFLWGVKLEVNNAVVQRDIEQLEKDVAAAQAIEKGVTANTHTLGRMEEKLNNVEKGVGEVKDLIRDMGR